MDHRLLFLNTNPKCNANHRLRFEYLLLVLQGLKMGEIAEARLNGEFCEGCGEYMGSGQGFPRRCDSCSDPNWRDGYEKSVAKASPLKSRPAWTQAMSRKQKQALQWLEKQGGHAEIQDDGNVVSGDDRSPFTAVVWLLLAAKGYVRLSPARIEVVR